MTEHKLFTVNSSLAVVFFLSAHPRLTCLEHVEEAVLIDTVDQGSEIDIDRDVAVSRDLLHFALKCYLVLIVGVVLRGNRHCIRVLFLPAGLSTLLLRCSLSVDKRIAIRLG